MARSFRLPLLSLATLTLFAWTTSALHFYMDLKDKRCFIEELPSDTIIEGVSSHLGDASFLTRNEPGQYSALEWHEGEQKYKENARMGVLVEVTVCLLNRPTLSLRHQKRRTRANAPNPPLLRRR